MLDRVEFRKLIGPLKADQFKLIDEDDWKAYETSGQIIVEEKVMEHNEKVIKGKMLLTVRDQGQLVYSLEGVEFRTGSFDN